ncbi:pentatricopeptide repeat-containing protein At1g09900-like [Benincasa hispida]|uniref:pentatricopeptide repeat-containing protein At1g09900-like n=1 Tax=Benincasa hispida TaxID=102211 RepID=UPI0019024855|nr:pentatricopeptide repeat-containing protein At1g09900-like [Benincasa hispida]
MHLALPPSFFTTRPLSYTYTPFAANFCGEYSRLSANKQSHSIDTGQHSFTHNAHASPFKLEIEIPTRVTRIKSLPIPSEEGTEIFIMSQKRTEIRNVSEFNDRLMDFVSENELDLALKLLSNISSYGLVPNSRTFSIMIRGYCKKGELETAGKVLEQMVGRGHNPNDATVTVLVNAFCKRGKTQKALEMVEMVGRIGRKPTVQTYNCLLKGLCYVGRVEEACEMVTEMKKDRLIPDIYTYTALMDGLCKVGRSDEAMELLIEAEGNGLKPSVVTFNTLFNGYCKEGRPVDGIYVLNKMKQINCTPDRITYTTLLHGLIKWGKIRIALSTYKEMVSSGHTIEAKMMNTFMRALCRRSWNEKDLLEDAHQVFEKMKDDYQVIDQSTYGLLIQALCSGNMISEALANLHHMIEKGYSPRAIIIDVVVQTLCHRGSVDEALLVLGHGIPFRRFSFDLIIDELNKQEMRFSACNVYGLALKRGVNPTKTPR